MRLLNTKSLEFSGPYAPDEVPDYVILSHRWSLEEVTFADISRDPISQFRSKTRTKNGFAKIQGACELALRDGYAWIWIDSCCIDTSSSAELQETINSMWRYYADSNICYVYMADVPDSQAGWDQMFARSEWFTRGWTLQELIAPVCVEFYAKNWESIGTKFERHEQIAEITSIDSDVLLRNQAADLLSTAERLSWAAHREVTREEDESYSLLGLFDVNMPLLYGEGRQKAFIRLQEAVYNSTTDHSIFLFRHSLYENGQPLLADSPTRFCERSNCTPCLSRSIQCLPSDFRYGNVIASGRWCTEAHEQIMTTVTTLRNEMSTVLPLLDYRDVSNTLTYFNDDKPRTRITHVAVLNHTLREYPKGALCFLLRRRPESDACLRLQAFPAVLPHLGDLVTRLQKTKLLVCPDSTNLESNSPIDTTFCVQSDSLRVETWKTTGSIGHCVPSAQARENSVFEIQIRKPENAKRSVQISCLIASLEGSMLMLSVQLIRRDGIWSIKEVFEREQGRRERKLRTLFLSSILADRCSVQFADGRRLSVRLRRLPGSARARQEDQVLKIRYQISVELVGR